ncbi:hypothetical protein [Glutamicibacter sp. M10]|uniref:hypothetical protein n=1 Tax=Glutamicibacter sp. M10 TaxID=3023076 RepID=UPI0021C57AFC|nr:hypothetical protein [Glutamicibacter sp. M10]UXN33193.1 hypothetical protein N6V40_07215 [Glutamicibacter sp. M10]
MASNASDELIGTWVTGWAGARGYETRNEGRVHAALRHDTTEDWEYVIYGPSKEELAAVAETLKNTLTVALPRLMIRPKIWSPSPARLAYRLLPTTKHSW